MLRTLILRRLAQEEKVLGESLDYVRHILRVSFRAFLAFTKILSISKYRKVLPVDAARSCLIVHPRFVIVGAELAEKLECFAGENSRAASHQTSSVVNR